MLDQNITILLSALLGGLLSIAGSIVANYYIQHSSNKTQKQKEIRNILELIYKSTQTIIDCCREIEHQFKGIDISDEYSTLNENMNRIDFLVDLYLYPLQKEFEEYKREIQSDIFISSRYDNKSSKSILEPVGQTDLDKKTEATAKFRSSIRDFLKKKGYSYF